jgi:hypothetical protein
VIGWLLRRSFEHDLLDAQGLLATHDHAPEVVTEDDLMELPPAAQRYLRAMGVLGRQRVRSFTVGFRGRFRLRPDGPWLPAVALQHDSVDPIARVFTMVLRIGRVLPMVGHDTYLGGRGRMVGRLAGLVEVANGSGEEFDVGELSTWLNDAVLLAPSMLLSAPVSWDQLDDDTLVVSVRDHGRSVQARVRLDPSGRPEDYWTTDRWADLPDGLVRAEWRTPVPGWTGGPDSTPMPLPGGATWVLEDGPFTYVEGGFVPGTLEVDGATRA